MVQKKEWAIPQTFVQQFAANEYVAACWKIKCNVPSGIGYHETNGFDGYQAPGFKKVDGDWIWVEGDDYIAQGSGCGTYHNGVESDNGPVANAMWQESNGSYYPVFHFKARVHGALSDHFCTLGSEEWETNPNAS